MLIHPKKLIYFFATIFLLQACASEPGDLEIQLGKERTKGEKSIGSHQQFTTGNICAANSAGRTSTCGPTAGGCYLWEYRTDTATQATWTPLASSESACCYHSGSSSCTKGAISDTGEERFVNCPQDHPVLGRMKRCGLNCIGNSTPCNETLAMCGGSYPNFCGIAEHGGFCGNDCARAGCLSNGRQMCDDECYDPATEHCINGSTVCPLSDNKLCGGKCMDTSREHCVDNTVCLKSEDSVCGGKCYNSSLQKCIHGKICPRSTNAVCDGICFHTDRKKCISGVLCEVDDIGICGRGTKTCYDATKSCPDGVHICAASEDSYSACAGCYQTRSVSLGGSCHHNGQCRKGQCSGFVFPACSEGKCVCSSDSDCSSGEYCYFGVLGIGTNQCKPKKENGKGCTKRKHCISDRCYWGKCKACSRDSQCSSGKRCRSGVCR